jgi:hypothetical protein
MLVHLLAMLARPCQPGRHGAFIAAKGSNDSPEGTAVAQQGEAERHHVGRRLQAIEGRSLGGYGRLAAVLAPIALLYVAMPGDVPRPQASPRLAGGIVAELSLRVHRWPLST